jgi:6-phosphogluconate dehydrogenase
VIRPDVGLVGLGAMGRALALKLDDRGYRVVVHNRTRSVAERFLADRPGSRLAGALSCRDLVRQLPRPRRVLLVVAPGETVDEVLDDLVPGLAPGDLVMDAGNSDYRDTERRQRRLAAAGVHLLGMGLNLGPRGARSGISISAGGPQEGWELAEDLPRALAVPSREGRTFVTRLGPGGAGHYVKMVLNGIGYALLQGIAEVYDLLASAGLSCAAIADAFDGWNGGEAGLGSWLLAGASRVLRTSNPETGEPLLDLVLDCVQQGSSGRWTSEEALALKVPIPSIDVSVAARLLSELREERQRAAAWFPPALRESFRGRRTELLEQARQALGLSVLVSFAEGLALLQQGSRARGYDLDLADVAAVWRSGCLIEARLLDDAEAAFRSRPDLPNLLLAPQLRPALLAGLPGLRACVQTAAGLGVPALALSTALGYCESYHRHRLPANLIQAQRDDFGAHGYQRVDRAGRHHTAWG